MLNFKFSHPSYLTKRPCGMYVHNSEFSFNTAARGFHVDPRVWLPHFGKHLRAERETLNHWRLIAIFVREHSSIGANNDKPIVGHLPQEFLYHCTVSSCNVCMSVTLWNAIITAGIPPLSHVRCILAILTRTRTGTAGIPHLTSLRVYDACMLATLTCAMQQDVQTAL